jgi:EmrB/QacA subfamily drug resistance transporter
MKASSLLRPAALLGAFLPSLNTSVANLAVPTLMAAWHAPVADVQWVMTVYLMAQGTGAPLAGLVLGRWGGRNAVVAVFAGFLAASVACATAGSLGVLIAARLVQGLLGGLLAPLSITVLLQGFPDDRRSWNLSLAETAGWMAPVVGPVVAGALLQWAAWPWVFWLSVPLAAVGLVGAWWAVPAGRPAGDKPDWDVASIGLVVVGSSLLLLTLGQGRVWGWANPATVAAFVVAVGALVGFVVRQRTRARPWLNFRAFAVKPYPAAVVWAGVVNAGLFAGVFFVPYLLQTVQGLGPGLAGLVLFPSSLVMMAAVPLAGVWVTKRGPRGPAVVGLALSVALTLVLAALPAHVSPWVTGAVLVARNVGIALASVAALTAGLRSMPPDLLGHANAVTGWVRQSLASVGVTVLTLVSTVPGWGGVPTAFVVTAVALAALVVLVPAFKEVRRG